MIFLLCADVGPDSVDRSILVNRDSKQNGRLDDFGVPFLGLNLNIAVGLVDQTISVCRTRVQIDFKEVFGRFWIDLVLPTDVMVLWMFWQYK